MLSNIRFNYLYRDAGNYKKWSDLVFSNPRELALESIAEALRRAFIDNCLFIARQLRIPEIFLFARGYASSDDHCFHEFDSVERTAELANDHYSRTIGEFITQVNRESIRGWAVFDPQGGVAETRGFARHSLPHGSARRIRPSG